MKWPMRQSAKASTREALREEAKLQPDVWIGIAVLFVLIGILVVATAWFMGGL